MKKHTKLLHKIEHAGLVALVGLCSPGLNSLLPINHNPFAITETIEAKTKAPTSKITYYDAAKKLKKQVVKTTYYPNGSKKTVTTTNYNKQKKVTKKVTISYNNKKVQTKKVEIKYNYKNNNKYKTVITTKYVNGKLENGASVTTVIYNKAGKEVSSNTVTKPLTIIKTTKRTVEKIKFSGKEAWRESITTYFNGKITKDSTLIQKIYLDEKLTNLHAEIKYNYLDSKSKIVDKAIFYEDNQIFGELKCTYTQNTLTKIDYYNELKNGKIVENTRYTFYEYDMDLKKTTNETYIYTNSDDKNPIMFATDYQINMVNVYLEDMLDLPMEKINDHFSYIEYNDSSSAIFYVKASDVFTIIDYTYTGTSTTLYHRNSLGVLTQTGISNKKTTTNNNVITYYTYLDFGGENYQWTQTIFDSNTGKINYYQKLGPQDPDPNFFNLANGWTETKAFNNF